MWQRKLNGGGWDRVDARHNKKLQKTRLGIKLSQTGGHGCWEEEEDENNDEEQNAMKTGAGRGEKKRPKTKNKKKRGEIWEQQTVREGGEGEESRALGEVSDSKFLNDDRQRESSTRAGAEHVRLCVSRCCCTVMRYHFAILQQVGKTLQD